MKKISVLLLTVLLMLTITGCKPDDSDYQTVADLEFTGENDYGFDVPKETFEFSFYYKRQQNPDTVEGNLTLMNQYLLDNFNIVINQEVYDSNADERLNLMLASGDYPEVIGNLTRTDVLRLIDLGIVVDIAPMMTDHGPNFEKELGSIYDNYFEETGELYAVPRGWGILNIPDQSAFLRYDWYVEMGEPDFSTPQEYYELLKTMKTTYHNSEDTVYLMSWNERSTIESLSGVWGLKEGYRHETNGDLTHWINTTEGKDMTAWMNQIYRDGNMDPDAFTNTFADWKQKVGNKQIIGGYGPWYQSWSGGHEIWQKTETLDENEKFMQYPIQADGAEAAYLSPKNSTGFGYTVITDKAKNPEMIVRVMDFMITPMGSRLMAWGVPNTDISNWTFDGTNWDFTDYAQEGVVNSTLNYQENRTLGTNQIWMSHPQGTFSDDENSNAWIDQCFNTLAKWKKLLNENMAGTMYDNTAYRSIVFDPEDDITVKKEQVEDTIKTYWVKAVLSDTPEEFETNWAELVAKAKTAGVDDLQEYVSQQHKSILGN